IQSDSDQYAGETICAGIPQPRDRRLSQGGGGDSSIDSRETRLMTPRLRRGFSFCKIGLLLALPLSFATALSSYGLSHQQPVSFLDITRSAKITFKHENGTSAEKLMVETFGSGVAWLDYDNDGFLDLFFANGANLHEGKPSPGNVLLRNTGKGTFVDV